MERMSTLDAGFFFIEDENTPMHVGSVAVFAGPPPSYGDLVRLLVAKLAQVPRYRQRVRTVPLNLGRPVWTDDPHFEILYHVRHTAVPAPGGAEQLRNLAGRVFAQRLDMAKPLWEMYLVEGLAEDRWAIISKVHHCMIDGVAGWDLAALLLDGRPDEFDWPSDRLGSQSAELGKPPSILQSLGQQPLDSCLQGGARRYPRGHGVVLLQRLVRPTAEGPAPLGCDRPRPSAHRSRFGGSVTLADHKMDHKPVRARERPSGTGGMR